MARETDDFLKYLDRLPPDQRRIVDRVLGRRGMSVEEAGGEMGLDDKDSVDLYYTAMRNFADHRSQDGRSKDVT